MNGIVPYTTQVNQLFSLPAPSICPLSKRISIAKPESNFVSFGSPPNIFLISEIASKLAVIAVGGDDPDRPQYEMTEISASTALEDMFKKGIGSRSSVIDVLEHPDFQQHKTSFFRRVLSIDQCVTSRDLFPEDASFLFNAWSDTPEVSLVSLQALAQDLILEYLTKKWGRGYWSAKNIAEQLEKKGGVIDAFHQLMMRIAENQNAESPALYFGRRDLSKESELIKVEEAKKLQQKVLQLPKEQQAILFNVAFVQGNPYIYEPAEVLVKPEQYAINFMWINKNKANPQQQFLQSDLKEEFHWQFLLPISNWAKANPGSVINIWFDSTLVSEETIQRSKTALQNGLDQTFCDYINFRDIYSIDLVNSHSREFSPEMPIYFRVDLLRAIVHDHILENEEAQYSVYADLDAAQLTNQELFNKKTLRDLDDFGFVMTHGQLLDFENGFQIFNGYHRQCMQSHRNVIIDSSLKMAEKERFEINSMHVYSAYSEMWQHLVNALNLPSLQGERKNIPIKPISIPRSSSISY